MLDLLIDYAKRNDLILEPGVERRPVKWLITCTEEGRYTGIVPIGDRQGETMICPKTPGMNAGNKSHFLADSLGTIALYVGEDANNLAAATAKQRFFLHLLKEASKEIPVLAAGIALLDDPSSRLGIHRDLYQLGANPTDTATLRIGDRTILKETSWRSWWSNKRESLTGGERNRPSPESSICIVTGEQVIPARTQPVIKHLTAVGGAKGGDVLAGYDKDAFTSFGLKQSLNAAMSEETAAAYTAALNYLLDKSSVKLGNALSVYWFTGQDTPPAQDDVMSWFTQPPEQTAGAAERRARDLLTAIRTGRRPELAGSRFVSLLLSGAAGRVMVREVVQGSFEELAAHTEEWFNHLAIVGRGGKVLARDPKFAALAASLVRNDGKKSINEVLKEVPSPWLQQLWRAAITGGPIPNTALAQTVNRVRIDAIKSDKDGDQKERALRNSQMQTRMALIKAYLIRNQGDRHMQPLMNPDHPHPAYHCGRALALFARLQRAALGDVGAGVVQRYYTAAAQTPGLILGRLASNAKNHLNKLDAGLAAWYEGQLAEILSRIRDSVPRTLSLEEQSLFALGYYQQIAHFRAGRKGLPEGMADDASDTDQPE